MFTFPNKWRERGVLRSIYRQDPVSQCSASTVSRGYTGETAFAKFSRVSSGFYIKRRRNYIRASITLACKLDAQRARIYVCDRLCLPAGDGMTTQVFLNLSCLLKPSGWAGDWCRFIVSQVRAKGLESWLGLCNVARRDCIYRYFFFTFNLKGIRWKQWHKVHWQRERRLSESVFSASGSKDRDSLTWTPIQVWEKKICVSLKLHENHSSLHTVYFSANRYLLMVPSDAVIDDVESSLPPLITNSVKWQQTVSIDNSSAAEVVVMYVGFMSKSETSLLPSWFDAYKIFVLV